MVLKGLMATVFTILTPTQVSEAV
ncbi:hypothetical protein E2C01_074165 [Portunus trituberculatus]|uniref:Uncharacterized protein n=1 Tax=Portunus trituberculatus TaxID=210409 RepID=A0A5B7IFN0_PORTR|nr:hypothetical protein [Portunus trituberculatus]